jgi:AmpD protein
MSTALTLGADGWIDQARRAPSPNCDAQTEPPHLLVIHHISLPPGQFAGHDIERLFTNTLPAEGHPDYSWISQLRVSAHWLIRRDGELVQFVSASQRAWHAGASCWRGRQTCNDFSLGVELEGTGDTPFTDAQYVRLGELARTLAAALPIVEMTGHEHIAPGRKSDPGPSFDWPRAQSACGLPVWFGDQSST